MVQWFSNLFRRWKKRDRLLEFNRDRLRAQMQNLSDRLHDFKNEASYAIVRELIELAKNYQLLENAALRKELDTHLGHGRYQALSDLGQYLDSAIASKEREKKEGKQEPIRGTIHTHPKRTSNQAGAAI